jgi:hypothetical protein
LRPDKVSASHATITQVIACSNVIAPFIIKPLAATSASFGQGKETIIGPSLFSNSLSKGHLNSFFR